MALVRSGRRAAPRAPTEHNAHTNRSPLRGTPIFITRREVLHKGFQIGLQQNIRRVQVTGLPGAGKTTGIRKFISEHPEIELSYLDIRNFDRPKKHYKFRKQIIATPGNLIAESACGVTNTNTTIILLEPPIQQVYKQLLEREGNLDEDYLSLLAGLMTPAHHIIKKPEELPRLLKHIFIR